MFLQWKGSTNQGGQPQEGFKGPEGLGFRDLLGLPRVNSDEHNRIRSHSASFQSQ